MTNTFHPRLGEDYDGRERGKLWGFIPSHEERLKLDERRAGYTLLELHSYKLIMQTQKLPVGMPPVVFNANSFLPPHKHLTSTNNNNDEDNIERISGRSSDGRGDRFVSSCINSCDQQFNDLDLCVERGTEKAKYRTTNINARLVGCKGQWTLFRRCTQFRDGQIMKSVLSWEKKHVKQLRDDERSVYVEDLQAKIRYLEYLRLRAGDKMDQIEYDREKRDIEKRVSSLQSASFIST
eukprot:GHVS01007664.1.p1 GENE.GHVS01007664.1~~GHVS01007664.1.p1  ORF type:complete len:256 (+),score=53.32 GHVS01007664.1:59-769(+)